MEIYAIRDNKAKTMNTPFFQPTDVHALRAFRAEINRMDQHNFMYLFPEDFDLCHIGTFTEDPGVLDGKTAKGLLANGKTLQTVTD